MVKPGNIVRLMFFDSSCAFTFITSWQREQSLWNRKVVCSYMWRWRMSTNTSVFTWTTERTGDKIAMLSTRRGRAHQDSWRSLGHLAFTAYYIFSICFFCFLSVSMKYSHFVLSINLLSINHFEITKSLPVGSYISFYFISYLLWGEGVTLIF